MNPMTKKDTLSRLKVQERKLRQQIIVDAAREVFGQKTYDKASMAEIARTAGIGKSSIYTYFNSQEELYARIAYMDACEFIDDLEKKVRKSETPLTVCISYFLEYYIEQKSQWRMITHFALHGNKEMGAVEQLNDIGRRLMTVFATVFEGLGSSQNPRLLAHTLFSCLSGILIAFRNYPGRTEPERISHMKRIGSMVEEMVLALVNQSKEVS